MPSASVPENPRLSVNLRLPPATWRCSTTKIPTTQAPIPSSPICNDGMWQPFDDVTAIMNLLLTGGAGLIGSNVLRHVIDKPEIARLVNLDCLTYAGHLANLEGVSSHPKYAFEKVDLRDKPAVLRVVRQHAVTHVLHLAAESHVDRSISGPDGSPNRLPTRPTRPTPPARPPRTCSSAPATTPTASTPSSPTARTTTARSSSP